MLVSSASGECRFWLLVSTGYLGDLCVCGSMKLMMMRSVKECTTTVEVALWLDEVDDDAVCQRVYYYSRGGLQEKSSRETCMPV